MPHTLTVLGNFSPSVLNFISITVFMDSLRISHDISLSHSLLCPSLSSPHSCDLTPPPRKQINNSPIKVRFLLCTCSLGHRQTLSGLPHKWSQVFPFLNPCCKSSNTEGETPASCQFLRVLSEGFLSRLLGFSEEVSFG